MNCICGCGATVASGRQYVSGHNLHNLPRTDQHRKNIAESLRRAWVTKRHRLPVGSTQRDQNGYIRVKVVAGAGHWRAQHLLMIEEELGRRLRPGEHVHHVNAIPDDNRRENLHLFPNRGAHSAAHGSLNMLIDRLLRDGVIVFDRKTGRYHMAAKS